MLNLPEDTYTLLDDLKDHLSTLTHQRDEAQRVAAVLLTLLERTAPGSSAVWLESYEWLRHHSVAGAIVHETESE